MRTSVLFLILIALTGCAPVHSGTGRPLAQYAGARPVRNPAFNPATDSHNPNVAGPRASTEPVFVIPWKQDGTKSEQEREAERQRAIYHYRTLLMRDPHGYVEHHLFPNALRVRFQRIGIDVDLFTILIEPWKHDKAHSGKELYGAGGMWNWEWEQWLTTKGTKASLPDAWNKAFEMIDKYGLGPHGPLSPYRCGREVVHDVYDDPAPAAQTPK